MLSPVVTIFSKAPKIRDILVNQGHYLAHTADGRPDRPDELLDEHVELVNRFVERLCESHGLDGVIDRLILDIVEKAPAFEGRIDIAEEIKQRFVFSFLFHDFGKVNPNFQRDKMGNERWFTHSVTVPFFPAHGHSELSTYCFLRFWAPGSMNERTVALFYLTVVLSYPIARHHAPNLWDITAYFETGNRALNWTENGAAFEEILSVLDLDIPDGAGFSELIGLHNELLNHGEEVFKDCAFAVFALVKLGFSLLTAADYLATSAYAYDGDYSVSGVIEEVLREKMLAAVRSTTSYNAAIYEFADKGNVPPSAPDISRSALNLNRLRSEMGLKVLQNVRANREGRVFYIEAPTGGGKTNLSMLATAELLRMKPALNKVIYVFPFTTLVTQTYEALRNIFQLEDGEVTQLHARAGYRKSVAEDQKDGFYGKDKQNYLTYLFNHFPVTLCTHVRLFDWLITPHKETNYAFHRLANGIVVIDELQAYSPKHWDKVIFFIQQFARFFHTHFIIMSATLPKLGGLLPRLGVAEDSIVNLIPEAKDLYFRNPNFLERVRFDTSLLERPGLSTEELATEVIEKASAYAASNTKYPGSVYCIVECIFKRTASDLYVAVQQQTDFFDHVWVLSGTILEHRRQVIINRLKNPDFRRRKILLITTQVVEAGVDIDMDIGFKDQSILDSDEQLAGRINRNVDKPTSMLYLFRKDRAGILYEKDARFRISRDVLKPAEIQQILLGKNFDHLYGLVFDHIESESRSTVIENYRTYQKSIQHLAFDEIRKKFQLIEQETLSLFIPLKLPLKIESTISGIEKPFFNNDEIHFLNSYGVSCEGEIDGSEVFDLFLRMVRKELPVNDFIQQKTDYISMRGVLSKFVFSMFASPKFRTSITSFVDEEKSEYGYLYLSRFEDVYDEKIGLLNCALDDVTQQFIT